MPPMSDAPIFTRHELIDRLSLVNGFRLMLGALFFAFLTALGFLKFYFSPGMEAILFLGLFLFSYSLLTHYYLKTQATIAMVEVIFLSAFITLLDILMITVSIYFTGGGESPFFIFYLLSLLVTTFIFPYYLPGLFVWLAGVLLFYEGMIFMILTGTLPAFPRFLSGQSNPEVSWRITLINAISIPVILLAACLAAYFFSRHLLKERHHFKKILVEEETSQQEFAALSNISWIMTRIQDVDYMLEQVLEESFKLLKLHSGAIFMLNHKKISRGVPAALNNYLTKIKPCELPAEDDPKLRRLLKEEKIERFICKSLVAPKGAHLGMIIFFVRQGESPSQRGLFNFDAIVNELSIVLGYALFIDKIKSSKGKK